MKTYKMPIPHKPVSRAKGEKALLWILRHSMPKGYGGRRVVFETIDWKRPLERVDMALGSVEVTRIPQLVSAAPMEITIRLKILEKGKHYF